MQINSIGRLLHFFPRQYIDKRQITPINTLGSVGEDTTAMGTVKSVRVAGRGRKKRLEALLQDDSGTMKGVWFKGISYIKKDLNKDDRVAFHGTPKQYGSMVSMAHPTVHHINDEDDVQAFARITPVYPSNKFMSNTHITPKLLQRWMNIALDNNPAPEFLPDAIRQEHQLPERAAAYRMIHFPDSQADHRQALRRFKFEELFLFQLSMARVKHQQSAAEDGPQFIKSVPHTTNFFTNQLPFTLTSAQQRALGDIKRDVRSGYQMNRLLQGDVGSGKTVVAIGAMLMAIDNGYQAAFMAPTEILAEQHYRTLTKFLDSLDITVRLLVGNQNTALRTDVLTDAAGGTADIIVGTHSIIQQQVEFYNLGLAVIDEQHRFGVQQRAEILQKGTHPHVLVMSATPIPRSLAMTVYSDLDLSVIDELPGGRKAVKTALRGDKSRPKIYDFIEQELESGGQAYVVYPLVEESEKVDLKDATAAFERIKKRFSNFAIGLLHGRMKSDEKDAVMKAFMANDIQILVSTTVIEVGVDVPNASIMVIEHAERFGLSQLHQLRGRIGRGTRQSYCILMRSQQLSEEAQFRLQTMARTSDGFEIAEADLKLRGPGDFLGTQQSGLPHFTVADIVEDRDILEQAKASAWQLHEQDPTLEEPPHADLKRVFEPYFKEKEYFYSLS